MEILKRSAYTMLIPNNPEAIAVYCHSKSPLPHSNGREGRTLYNFQEEIAERMAVALPNVIVAVSTYDIKPMREQIIKLQNIYSIDSCVAGGWSLGGNNALAIAADLNADVLLMDCNHTNQVSDEVFKKLTGHQCTYISNNLNSVKLSKLSKAYAYLDIYYNQITIPAGVKVSNHRYCRDYALDNGLYAQMIKSKLRTPADIDDCDKSVSGLLTEED